MQNLEIFDRKNPNLVKTVDISNVAGSNGSRYALPLIYDTQSVIFSVPTNSERDAIFKHLERLYLCENIGTFHGGSNKTFNETGNAFSSDTESTGIDSLSIATKLNMLLGVQPFTLELTKNLYIDNVLRVLDVFCLDGSSISRTLEGRNFMRVELLIVRK